MGESGEAVGREKLENLEDRWGDRRGVREGMGERERSERCDIGE